MPRRIAESTCRRNVSLAAAIALTVAISVGSAQAGALVSRDNGTGAAQDSGSVCTVEPRSFDEIQRLSRSAMDQIPAPGNRVAREPATSAVSDSLEALVAEFLRCSAAGEPLRVWSLYSDAYLARLLSRERGYDRARYEADAEPRPVSADAQPILRSFADVTVASHDHAAARVAIFYPNLDREKAFEFHFIRVEGVWLIDEIQGEITFSVP